MEYTFCRKQWLADESDCRLPIPALKAPNVIFWLKSRCGAGYLDIAGGHRRRVQLKVEPMAKRYPHRDAARLAGEVFGRILDRQADRDGYEYVLDCLESGKKSVQQIVLEFIASDEFIDKFAASGDAAHTVGLVNKLLLGRLPKSETEMQAARRQFIRLGLRQYAEQIANSPEYMRSVGTDSVPGTGHHASH
jgi:hypothetical protein